MTAHFPSFLGFGKLATAGVMAAAALAAPSTSSPPALAKILTPFALASGSTRRNFGSRKTS